MPVPPDTLIWHLAVFRRLFSEMEAAAEAVDREAIWLCQWAAEALHNVPDMLCHYDEPLAWHDPEKTARHLLAFPDLVTRLGAPLRLVSLGQSMVSKEGTRTESGLGQDLRNLDVAPEGELEKHLQRLGEFCLATRQRYLWVDLDEDGWRGCEFQGRHNGIIGRTAKKLPVGLVHWHEFDPLAFHTEIERAYTELPPWPDLSEPPD